MVPGAYVPIRLPEPPPAVRQEARPDDRLTVEYLEAAFDSETQQWTFTGGVVARYGPTRLEAPRLVVDLDDRRGEATGGVRITDPEGSIRCESFVFDWHAKTGLATGAVIQVDQTRFESARVEVAPGKWMLHAVRAAFTRTGESNVWMEAESLSIRPGIDGSARRVYMVVRGKRLGPLPRMSFSLRRRVKGFGLPSITNRRGAGIGVSWDVGLALGDYGVANVFWNAFPRQAPGFGLGAAFSPLDPETRTPINPASDLAERFADGWFDNVAVARPEDEDADLREPRLSYGAGSFWNQGTVARMPDGTDVSKRLEAVYEAGGPAGAAGFKWRAGLQSVRPDSRTAFRERAVAAATLGLPPLRLSRALDARARLDGFATASGKGSYGFVRAEAGLVYRPSGSFTLGAAYVAAGEAGRADFAFDRVVSKSAVHLRADYQLGPYTARYLAKYDTARALWYDREYELALAAGAFEPFLQFREFPSETRIGVRLRIESLADKLQRRRQSR